jgi:hypothetical protein
VEGCASSRPRLPRLRFAHHHLVLETRDLQLVAFPLGPSAPIQHCCGTGRAIRPELTVDERLTFVQNDLHGLPIADRLLPARFRAPRRSPESVYGDVASRQSRSNNQTFQFLRVSLKSLSAVRTILWFVFARASTLFSCGRHRGRTGRSATIQPSRTPKN